MAEQSHSGPPMTRLLLTTYNLVQLARWAWGVVAGACLLALMGCESGSDRRATALEHSRVVSRTEMYSGPGPELIERFVMDDGTTCYRYFHTGSNGWSCVRLSLEVHRAPGGPA